MGGLKESSMRDAEGCTHGGQTKRNGNCTNPDPMDGLAVECVGPWAEDKHYYLRQFIAASADWFSSSPQGW